MWCCEVGRGIKDEQCIKDEEILPAFGQIAKGHQGTASLFGMA